MPKFEIAKIKKIILQCKRCNREHSFAADKPIHFPVTCRQCERPLAVFPAIKYQRNQ